MSRDFRLSRLKRHLFLCLCGRSGIFKHLTGKKLKKALKLRDARRKSGLKYGNGLDRFIEKYPVMENYVCSDAGMLLMFYDSCLILSIQNALAEKGIPCLSVHDSIIVPKSEEKTAHRIMVEEYRGMFNGFTPHIKKVE